MTNLKKDKNNTNCFNTTNVENFNVPRSNEKLKTWSCGEKYFSS